MLYRIYTCIYIYIEKEPHDHDYNQPNARYGMMGLHLLWWLQDLKDDVRHIYDSHANINHRELNYKLLMLFVYICKQKCQQFNCIYIYIYIYSLYVRFTTIVAQREKGLFDDQNAQWRVNRNVIIAASIMRFVRERAEQK